ncbi:MAG: hypothetical protein RL208_84 [Pseudomonadota bacterium]|jgi:hypothetical protein
MQSVIGFIIQDKSKDKIFVQKRSATRKSYAKSAQIASWVAAISMVVQIIVLIYKQ